MNKFKQYMNIFNEMISEISNFEIADETENEKSRKNNNEYIYVFEKTDYDLNNPNSFYDGSFLDFLTKYLDEDQANEVKNEINNNYNSNIRRHIRDSKSDSIKLKFKYN